MMTDRSPVVVLPPRLPPGAIRTLTGRPSGVWWLRSHSCCGTCGTPLPCGSSGSKRHSGLRFWLPAMSASARIAKRRSWGGSASSTPSFSVKRVASEAPATEPQRLAVVRDELDVVGAVRPHRRDGQALLPLRVRRVPEATLEPTEEAALDGDLAADRALAAVDRPVVHVLPVRVAVDHAHADGVHRLLGAALPGEEAVAGVELGPQVDAGVRVLVPL